MKIQSCNRVQFGSNPSIVTDSATIATRKALKAFIPKSACFEQSGRLGAAYSQGACDMVHTTHEPLPLRKKKKAH